MQKKKKNQERIRVDRSGLEWIEVDQNGSQWIGQDLIGLNWMGMIEVGRSGFKKRRNAKQAPESSPPLKLHSLGAA